MDDTGYFNWLCEKVNLYSSDNDMYTNLIDSLRNREFYSIIANDDNRAADGKYLRVTYDEEFTDIHYQGDFDAPCTVLEMLIALAERMDDDILYSSELGPRVDVWFWMMIHNLGLDYATDDHYALNDNYGQTYVDHVLDMFLNRKYKANGVGGLFPLREPHENQRNLEIWFQMNDYISENYRL